MLKLVSLLLILRFLFLLLINCKLHCFLNFVLWFRTLFCFSWSEFTTFWFGFDIFNWYTFLLCTFLFFFHHLILFYFTRQVTLFLSLFYLLILQILSFLLKLKQKLRYLHIFLSHCFIIIVHICILNDNFV